ncbi:gamma-glutamylcyclotransferase [Sinorhizobium numidicum]|uniref:Gamma-glutamylcyclotransferase family protein n=1 Tax=Sinorhizobium numidicum TaxID=680248 RepID=A0ABY8CWD1_9HYPH|nr:gamma-glutamylcyclotransferase family protein [Sinorhizobium numidicum]WEX76293.1 gamma-glutamylcyclotransferase [Sinorhizobium numidicum]WEX82953.1 gamma-glutamylcyclotransferase [Sinorhizobium numidicum]
MKAASVRVFVFGTLKEGFPLHRRGLAQAKFIGLYQTDRSYPMLIAGPWFVPMMFYEPGVGFRVSGELYEIDSAKLRQLDRLESTGRPGNFRKLIRIVPARPGPSCQAFAYFKARFLAVPAHSGYLASYHDRRFIPPWRRPAV